MKANKRQHNPPLLNNNQTGGSRLASLPSGELGVSKSDVSHFTANVLQPLADRQATRLFRLRTANAHGAKRVVPTTAALGVQAALRGALLQVHVYES
jgi:hypothetical protein